MPWTGDNPLFSYLSTSVLPLIPLISGTLLNRLKISFGITGHGHDWIRSYLSKDKQFVRIGKSCHRVHLPHRGAPGVSAGANTFLTLHLQGDVLSHSSVATHSERTDRGHSWWAQGWTMPTQFCMECRAQTSTNCNVCKNTIARIVKLSRSNTGMMDISKDLHWLPVRYRIDFKIATLVYKVRSSSQPVYLSSLISEYAWIRSLCSTGTHILYTPRVNP